MCTSNMQEGSFGYENMDDGIEFDMRSLGWLPSIKNQESCSCCWAMSSLYCIEAMHKKLYGEVVELSTQELIDNSPRREYCGPYKPRLAFDYIVKNGISYESDYPFIGKEGKGQPRPKVHRKYNLIKSHGVLNSEEEIISYLHQHGPVVVAVRGEEELKAMRGSWAIYKPKEEDFEAFRKAKNLTRDLFHAIAIVGYGKEADVPYWIVANSWGESWGIGGYGRISRDPTIVKPCAWYPKF